ncbi:ANTAR domain-containing protein [Geodermatophilus sp. SYSU D00766]
MTIGESSSPGRPPSVDEVMAQLASLDVRSEELEVVSEELRVQQEQVTALLGRHEAEVRWRSQLAAVVPLGLALTDGNGKLLEANPALVGAVGVGPGRLLGKPLSVFLSPEDVLAFRNALRALSRPAGAEQRLDVTLRPRSGPQRRSELFGFTETPGPPASARVQWVLAPRDGGVQEQRTAAVPDDLPPDAGAGEVTDVLGLAAAFAQLSALPVDEPDRQRMLGRMATLVRSAVAGADWVSITLGSPLAPQRLGSDSPEAQDLDGRQLRVQEGPCWDAYRTGRAVSSPDVRADDRWSRLRALAADAAVRAVLAVPVREDGETTGVINLYSARPETFGTANRRIGELAAAAVAGVLQNVAEREALTSLAGNLERALTSRAVIDQAKGVLVARLGVGPDEAFARLVALSNRLNVKVRDLARLVVEGDTDLVIAAGD